jgi:hypothetical protein
LQLDCREQCVETDRNKKAPVYVNFGVDAGLAIEVKLAAGDTEAVEINIGCGPEVMIDCADVESLERLSAVAGEGARLLRDRIAENRATATRDGAIHAERLAGAGVTR